MWYGRDYRGPGSTTGNSATDPTAAEWVWGTSKVEGKNLFNKQCYKTGIHNQKSGNTGLNVTTCTFVTMNHKSKYNTLNTFRSKSLEPMTRWKRSESSPWKHDPSKKKWSRGTWLKLKTLGYRLLPWRLRHPWCIVMVSGFDTGSSPAASFWSCGPQKAAVMVRVMKSLSSTEPWVVSQAHSFVLVQSQLLWAFREWASGRQLSILLSPCFSTNK